MMDENFRLRFSKYYLGLVCKTLADRSKPGLFWMDASNIWRPFHEAYFYWTSSAPAESRCMVGLALAIWSNKNSGPKLQTLLGSPHLPMVSELLTCKNDQDAKNWVKKWELDK